MAESTIKKITTNITDNTYTNVNISSSRVIKNADIKLAEINLVLQNLISGSSTWETMTINEDVFPKPINNIYGQLGFQGQGDFRILNNPFSIDVNLRGSTDVTPSLHVMYFYV